MVVVRVLFFGVLREVMGAEERRMELPEGATAGAVVERCRAEARAESAVWGVLAVAVNEEYSRRDRLLLEGDVVALLPPVSGGGGSSEAGR